MLGCAGDRLVDETDSCGLCGGSTLSNCLIRFCSLGSLSTLSFAISSRLLYVYVVKVPAERLMAGVGPLIDYFFPEPVLVIEL